MSFDAISSVHLTLGYVTFSVALSIVYVYPRTVVYTTVHRVLEVQHDTSGGRNEIIQVHVGSQVHVVVEVQETFRYAWNSESTFHRRRFVNKINSNFDHECDICSGTPLITARLNKYFQITYLCRWVSIAGLEKVGRSDKFSNISSCVIKNTFLWSRFNQYGIWPFVTM